VRKRHLLCLVLIILLATAACAQAATVSAWGKQYRGSVLDPPKLEGDIFTLPVSGTIVEATCSGPGFWMVDVSTGVVAERFDTAGAAVGVIILAGSYRVFPNLGQAQNAANVSVKFNLIGGGAATAAAGKGPIFAERKRYVDLWEQWMEAEITCAKTNGQSSNVAQVLQARNDAGKAFSEYAMNTFARIPEVSSNIMMQAMTRVRDIQCTVFSAVGSGAFPVGAARKSIPAIEKALLDPEPYKPQLPPEGQKQTVLDNPQFGLKYWLVTRDGRLYMDGYYHAADGRKVEYKSRPMDETDPLSAAVGLFATASGTGYHIYIEEKKPWQQVSHSVLNVTMMKGADITEVGRFDIHQFGYKIGELMVPFVLEESTPGGAWMLKYKVYERRDDLMDVSGLQEKTVTFE